jgi:ABC-2 type transport system permease protein
MNRSLWKKNLSEGGVLLLALIIGAACFAWFRVNVVGELDTTSFRRIMDLVPKSWLKFASVDLEWLISYSGRTGLTLDEPFLIMMFAIWAIVRGSDVVSGEISRGTMEMLLAQPVSRRRVFLIQVGSTILGLAILCLATWLAMWLAVHTTSVKVAADPAPNIWSLPTMLIPGSNKEPESVDKPMSEFVDAADFIPGVVSLFSLAAFVTGFTTLMSSMDRFRWRTLGIAAGFYLVAAMIKILAIASTTFSWAHWLSFFSLYEPEVAIKASCETPELLWQFWRYGDDGAWEGFGILAQNMILLGGAIVFLIAAWRIFERRDIPQPL